MASRFSEADLAAMAARARQRVQTLAGGHPSRSALFPERLARAAAYIEHEFWSLGCNVQVPTFDVKGKTFSNVAVELPGAGGSAVIVIGAHYDTVAGTPGADDNASGVAGLLELAQLLRDSSLKHTVILVAYANEEPPHFHTIHMGSRHHAKSLKSEGRSVRLMFALEMLGYAGDELRQVYPFPGMRRLFRYPERGNFISVVGNIRTRRLTPVVCNAVRNGSTIGVEKLTAPGFLPPLFLSDHSSYWREGYPAVMITDTAFLRNPHYHQSSDTADTLNYDFLAQVIAGVYAAIMAVDQFDS